MYFIMLSTLFIPFTVTMIPNYLLISKIGLRDRIWGVALPQLADVLEFSCCARQCVESRWHSLRRHGWKISGT
ncbi:MAG: hypothetical protein ACLR3S_00205 [Clostridium fessum]